MTAHVAAFCLPLSNRAGEILSMRSLESVCRLVRLCFNGDGLFIQFPTTEFGFIASQDPCEAERLNGAFADMLDGATTLRERTSVLRAG